MPITAPAEPSVPTMRAVVFTDYGSTPELATVAEPDCPADGVLVRVGATGVCRSDWHAWHGHDPVALPHIPGHEMAGVVDRVGPDVTRWRVGDRVTAPVPSRFKPARGCVVWAARVGERGRWCLGRWTG